MGRNPPVSGRLGIKLKVKNQTKVTWRASVTSM